MSRSAELHRQSTMNIVITGATGVIGRHAVQQLIDAGQRVTGITRPARGERTLEDLRARSVRAPRRRSPAETNVRELFAGDTVVLRFGLFIGPDSGLTQTDIDAARRKGVSPSVGRRDAYRPTAWIDDAAAAVAAVLDAPAGKCPVTAPASMPRRTSTTERSTPSRT